MNHYTGNEYLIINKENGKLNIRTENNLGVIDDNLSYSEARQLALRYDLHYSDLVQECESQESYLAISTELSNARRAYKDPKQQSKLLKARLNENQFKIANEYIF